MVMVLAMVVMEARRELIDGRVSAEHTVIRIVFWWLDDFSCQRLAASRDQKSCAGG